MKSWTNTYSSQTQTSLATCSLRSGVHSKKSRNPTFEVRGLTYTNPTLRLRSSVDKEMSRNLAKNISDVAKAEFEEADPNKIRAGELRVSLRLSVRRLPQVSSPFLPFAWFVDFLLVNVFDLFVLGCYLLSVG